MRLKSILTAGLLAAGAVVASAAPASAHIVDATTGTTGSCPAGYGELVRADQTVVCWHVYLPDAVLIENGASCPTGYAEYSVLNGYRGVCLKLNH